MYEYICIAWLIYELLRIIVLLDFLQNPLPNKKFYLFTGQNFERNLLYFYEVYNLSNYHYGC